MEVIETDILIIGSGAAGLRASIEASKRCETIVVDKALIGISSSSFLAEAGINAIVNKEDSVEKFFYDTLRTGRFINDKKLVKILAEESSSRIKDLENFGIKFSKSLRRLSGSSIARTKFIDNKTGTEIIKALLRKSKEYGTEFISDCFLIDLISKNGKILGGVFYNLKKGEILIIFSKKTIISTGGACNLYEITTNPTVTSGEGISLCYKAGAMISDIEFVQFHPTSINIEGYRGVMLTEALRYEGAKILNKYNRRFVNEMDTRDIVTRKIFEEIEKGNGPIYLDISNINLEEKFPKLYEFLKRNKLPLDKIKIIPSAHYFLGGVVIDDRCRTNLKNLFACGEVASGIHGANRMAGNSLTDTQVFGYRAGVYSSNEALEEKFDRICISKRELYKYYEEKIFKKRKGENVYILVDELKKIMFKYVGIIRDYNSLIYARDRIERLSKKNLEVEDGKIFNLNIVKFFEFKNMLILAKLIIKASLKRKESRGCFFRRDYPNENIKFKRRIFL